MPFSSSHSSRSSLSSSSSSHVLLRLICQSLLLLVSFVAAQEAFPTDDSIVTPPLGAPQFFLYTRQFALDPAFLVPLTKSMSDAPPSDFNVTGTLVDVSPENANNLNEDQIALVSCDDSAYPGNQKVKDTLKELISNNPTAGATILYTERDRYHCEYTADMSLPPYPNIFTLTRASIAQELQNKLKSSPTGSSSIVAEDPSPSETGVGAIETGGSSSPLERDRGNTGPTTSVAMIILYSVTGVITLLFLGVILTGAVRAHMHPERYGPRNIIGRPRQSRAKGLARAMLETLPIVKFGDLDEPTAQPGAAKAGDVEMGSSQGGGPEEQKKGGHKAKGASEEDGMSQRSQTSAADHDRNLSGRDDGHIGPASSSRAGTPDGPEPAGETTLGCPICTDDFEKGQDVRLLPCDHKFHPECIDPWLVNVSGTCPLCRIDLHPHDEDEQQLENPDEQPAEDDGRLPPPLRDNRGPGNEPEGTRDRRRRRRSLATYIQSTINAMPPNDASIEQRLEAVRRLRSPQQPEGAQTAATGAIGASSENRRSRRFSTMLLDSFRIHTRRHGEEM
uniref:RING-7 protein n=1 Tax=Coccidioides posadasii RMSCC 3488 TaxID=454284 RepID=A0A0J6FIV6_COCPO|nr:RING-7 protein [Coccidioides posadasii RMSCC 3488]